MELDTIKAGETAIFSVEGKTDAQQRIKCKVAVVNKDLPADQMKGLTELALKVFHQAFPEVLIKRVELVEVQS